MANELTEPELTQAPRKALSPQAKRALAEAQDRRNARCVERDTRAEVNGRPGPEPVRYGDWENKGIATDF